MKSFTRSHYVFLFFFVLNCGIAHHEIYHCRISIYVAFVNTASESVRVEYFSDSSSAIWEHPSTELIQKAIDLGPSQIRTDTLIYDWTEADVCWNDGVPRDIILMTYSRDSLIDSSSHRFFQSSETMCEKSAWCISDCGNGCEKSIVDTIYVP